MLLAFRRPQSPYVTARLALRGLLPEARYELVFADTSVRQTVEGSALADGLVVTIDSVPGSALITYRRLTG
jgi:hypothetical protein